MQKQNGARRVTLRDIAAKTGFSVNTVSHALKDQPDISEKTKQLIRQTAREMGYIRNAPAGILRSGVSRTVAIVLGDLSNPLFAITVKGLEVELKKRGYVSFVINTEENRATERMALEMAIEKNVDGVVLCPSPDGEENVSFLQQRGIPFVLHGRYFPALDTSAVLSDDRRCGYLAARHLLELGHRKLLFFNAPLSVSSARERLEGCREALAGFGQADCRVLEVAMDSDARRKQMRRALAGSEDTAVLAFSDMMALEVIALLQEMGRPVPEAVSVVGFDNIQSDYLLPVALTTAGSSKTMMVQKSVELLMAQIQKGQAEAVRLVFPAALTVRKTTKSRL